MMSNASIHGRYFNSERSFLFYLDNFKVCMTFYYYVLLNFYLNLKSCFKSD